MRKKWKTRWNAFWEDSHVQKMIWGSSLLASSTVSMLSLLGDGKVSITFAFLFTQTVLIFGIYGSMLIEILLDEEHPYDEKVRYGDMLQAEMIPILTEKDVQEHLDSIVRAHYHLQQEEQNEILKENIYKLLDTLHHCKKYTHLTKEERYKLFAYIPKQICHNFTLYRKLTKKNKQKMKQHVQSYIQDTIQLIEQTYIYPSQDMLQRDLEKQMKILRLPID